MRCAPAACCSGIRELDPTGGAAGSASGARLATPQQPLRDGDRVELYRPLLIDPKEARRLRQQPPAQAAKAAERRAGKAR